MSQRIPTATSTAPSKGVPNLPKAAARAAAAPAKPVQRAAGGAEPARRDIERGDFFHRLSRFPKSEATLIETLNRIDRTSAFLKAELLKHQVEEEERHYQGSIEGLVKSDIDLMKGFAKSAYLDTKLGAKLREIHACIGQLYQLEKTLTTQLSQGYEAVVASAHGNLSDIHTKFYNGPAVKTVVQSDAAEVQKGLKTILKLEEQAKNKGADSFEAMLTLITKAEELAESTKQMSKANEVQLGTLLPKLREIAHLEEIKSRYPKRPEYLFAINFGMHRQFSSEPDLNLQSNTLSPIQATSLILDNGDILSIHTIYQNFTYSIWQGSVYWKTLKMKNGLALQLKNTNLVIAQGADIKIWRLIPCHEFECLATFTKEGARYLDPCLELRNGDVLVKVFDDQLNCRYFTLNTTRGFGQEILQNFPDSLQKIKSGQIQRDSRFYFPLMMGHLKNLTISNWFFAGRGESFQTVNIWDRETGAHKRSLGVVKFYNNPSGFHSGLTGILKHSAGAVIFNNGNALDIWDAHRQNRIGSFVVPGASDQISFGPVLELPNGKILVTTCKFDLFLLDLKTGFDRSFQMKGTYPKLFSNGKVFIKGDGNLCTLWDMNKDSGKIDFRLDKCDSMEGIEEIDGGQFLLAMCTTDKGSVMQLRDIESGDLIKSSPISFNVRSMHYLGNNEFLVKVMERVNCNEVVHHDIYDSRTLVRKHRMQELDKIDGQIAALRADIRTQSSQSSHLNIETMSLKAVERSIQNINESNHHFANMKKLLSSVKEALRSRAASLQSNRQAVQRFSSSIDATEDISDREDLQASVEAVIDDSLFFQYQLLNQSHNKYMQDVCIDTHSGDEVFEEGSSRAAEVIGGVAAAGELKAEQLSNVISMIQKASVQSYCTQVLKSAGQGKSVVPRGYSEGLIKELKGRLTISNATKKTTTTNLAKTGGGASKEGGGAAAPAKPGNKK